MQLLKVVGVIVAAAGFLGREAAQRYLQEHVGQSLEASVLEALRPLGAQQQVSTELQVAEFFVSYGVIVGVAGLVLIILGYMLQRKA